jgi:hypothetical protein
MSKDHLLSALYRISQHRGSTSVVSRMAHLLHNIVWAETKPRVYCYRIISDMVCRSLEQK